MKEDFLKFRRQTEVVFERLGATPDAESEGIAAGELMRICCAAGEQSRVWRNDAIAAQRDAGVDRSVIARNSGLSKTQVAAILRDAPSRLHRTP